MGAFDLMLGVVEPEETPFIIDEQHRLFHEIIVGSSLEEIMIYAALPRIEQDLKRLAKGENVALFVVAETREIIEMAAFLFLKYKLAFAFFDLSHSNEDSLGTNSLHEVMRKGGIVLIYLGDRMDQREENLLSYIERFERCAFNRPLSKRIPTFITIQSSTAVQSPDLLRLTILGHSYRVGVCLIVDSLNSLYQGACQTIWLKNTGGITFFRQSELVDRIEAGLELGIEPHLLHSSFLKKGYSYYKYYNPFTSDRGVKLIRLL